jgi:hypothetical protein
MNNLSQKEVKASLRWLGRKVRRDRSEKWRQCVGIRAYGPPSGWNAVFEITCADGYSFTVSKFGSVETEDKPRKLANK